MGAFDVFIERQGTVVEHLAEAARQVPAEKTNWKPCDRSLPWLYLIHHPSIHRKLFTKLFKGEPHDFPACYGDPANQPETPEDAARMGLESWEEFTRFLRSQPDGFLAKEVEVPWGGSRETVEQMLWWMYEESVHHRGQAWVYARMNGITPPSIWGTEREM